MHLVAATSPIDSLRARLALMPDAVPGDPDFQPEMLQEKFERAQIAEQKAAQAVRRAQNKQRKLEEAAEAGEPPPEPLSDGVKRAIEIRMDKSRNAAAREFDKRSKVAERWDKFTHHGGQVADRWYVPFTEQITRPDGTITGLRSHDGSISTALFASLLPKVNALQWGNDKRKLLKFDMTQRKIFVLDAPYICTDPRRLGVLVIDLDTNWESEESLLKAIRGIVGANKMPNLVVYRFSEDGTEIESPHLIWLLPPKDENGRGGCVGTTGKSDQRIVQLFHRTQRALVAKFVPIGADTGHHNVLKVKNPLSPYWNIFVNDDNFVSLSEWNNILQLNISEEEISRLAAVHQVAGV